MIAAGIDCGTNSIRLLIAEVREDGTLEELDRRTRIVRLGQGVDATGAFAPEALERTFEAVDEYAEALKAHEVSGLLFGATSATRDASNREEFLEGVRSRLGVTPRVISGDEEARLSFTGATVASGDEAKTLVVDLGGGSTEFVVGRGRGAGAVLDGALSTDMGCVRFTERFLRTDPPTAQEIEAARAAAREKIADAEAAVGLTGLERVVGVAGTVTTVMAAALGLGAYDRSAIHDAPRPIGEVRKAAMDLLARPRAEREALGFMHPGRVDVIGAGALIFDAVLERIQELNPGLDEVRASETDILDGLTLKAAEEAR